MAPESQCMSREGVVESHRSFMTRVMSLPAVDQAATIYRYTKEQQPYVGVALRLAEAGIMKTVTATGAIIPLAAPIANHVDELACQVLDNVVKVAPIITKPTDEIVDDTHHFVMRSIAGGQHHSKQLTLKTALVARASDVVDRASATDYGRALYQLAEAVLHSAHHAVDTYLPPAEGDLHHTEGTDGDLSSRAFSLAYKTQCRLRRTALHIMKKGNNGCGDDEDIVIYPLHLVENGNHHSVKWYYSLHDNSYIRKAADVTSAAQSIVLRNVGFFIDPRRFQRIFCTIMIEPAVKGISIARSCTSRSIDLGKSVTVTAIDKINTTTNMVGSAVNKAFSSAVFTTSVMINSSREIVETLLNTGVSMAHAAFSHCKTLPDMGVSRKSKRLLKFVQITFNDLTAQGKTCLYAGIQYCSDITGKILAIVPQSLYVQGNLLYMQLLSTCMELSQYPIQTLQTSSKLLESAQQITIDSYTWLSSKELFIQSYLVAVTIQSQLASLLKGFGFGVSKAKMS